MEGGEKMSTEIDVDAYISTDEPEEIDGIPTSELWSLDATLTDYILPRLKAFKKMKRHAFPIMEEFSDEECDDKYAQAEWEARLDKMILGFESHDRMLTQGEIYDLPADKLQKEQDKIAEGLTLFTNHFIDLWD